MAFSRKSQLSISDLTVLRHPCTEVLRPPCQPPRPSCTTAPSVMPDHPLRHARPSPPSCPTIPSVMPDLIGHLSLPAGRVYRKTAPHGPPPVNAAPFWPKTAIPPFRVYIRKHPKRRFRVNASSPSCPTCRDRHALLDATVMPDLIGHLTIK